MELLTFTKNLLHNVAEQAVSYRLGQTVLKHVDRALWVLEKSARWAVPPPLDQDERPQPELVRPLPWMFFLALLVTLRVTRESISLFNLVLGKPPLRSADVVTYIQSKRRYLRTLKYQGNRMMRARATSSQPQEPWYRNLQKLFEFTMCFRRNSYYGNNNSMSVSNNEEVLVVKRCKQKQNPVVATGEPTMEKLIEKMMVDLDAESDADSDSLTLTNVKSDTTSEEICESGEESVKSDPTIPNHVPNASTSEVADVRIDISPPKPDVVSSTPEKESIEINSNVDSKESLSATQDESKNMSPKEESQQFILNEKCSPLKPRKLPIKMGNGQAIKNTSTKKKENIRHQSQKKQ